MVSFLEKHQLMDSSQHGSRSGRSTLTQLIHQHDKILEMMSDGDNVDIVYLDFAKAFDKVDLGLLILKFRSLGILGTLGRWLSSFISGRRQAVKVGSRISKWSQVVSGVPQGSVLGPILFLIFISDLGLDLDQDFATLLKYVDDTKCFSKVAKEEDVEALQGVLNSLYKWQVSNNMEWNDGKFQVVRLGRILYLKHGTSYFTSDYGDVIQQVEEAKDLGLIVDEDASFKPQRVSAVAKTRAKASWVLRVFRTRNVGTLRTLWCSLIQPHQDYCSQLWSPVLDIGEIESQEGPLRAFTKRGGGLYNTPYWDRLKLFKLSSTERRTERYKIIYVWKILRGLVPNCSLVVSSTNVLGRKVTIPPLSGTCERVQTLKEKSFCYAGPKLFNALPRCLRDCNLTLASFKKNLDTFLMLVPDQPARAGGAQPECVRTGTFMRTNSLVFWISKLGLNNWCPPKGSCGVQADDADPEDQ